MALLPMRDWMTKASVDLDDASAGSRQEMIIQSALASCMMFTDGMTESRTLNWAKIASCRVPQRYRIQLDSLACSLGYQIRFPAMRGDRIGGSVRRCR